MSQASGPSPDAAIVIPSIRVDALLRRCVEACSRQHPAARIVVVVDEPADADLIGDVAEVLVTSGVSIAGKRNLGVAHAGTADHVAFIDSDAVPEAGWLDHAVRILEHDPGLAAVGGPNVSPEHQSRWERYVGLAHLSFLVDGWWTFRKRRTSAARDVVALPTCNLVVRRSDFDAVGGMNELLFTAEDTDFCTRLVRAGRRIRFSPDVVVAHKNRDLAGFVVQRFTFGVAMVPLLRRGAAPDLAYCVVSAGLVGFVVFVLSAPVALLRPRWRRIWLGVMGAYAALVTAEAVRVSPAPSDVPGSMVTLTIGNLAPGVGLVLRALRLSPELQGVYRNDT